jgi:hypothetical protein
MHKRLPVGISDFKQIIDGNYAYVDKTLLIQEILDKGTQVSLITRLRRFGKTLNLSMLRYFFEKSEEDRSYLFRSLKIWKETNYQNFQGQFPVIFLTLKDIKHSSWQETLQSFRLVIANEFVRHAYLLEGNFLTADEKELFHLFQNPLSTEVNQTLYEASLLFLMKWLHSYHKKRVVLLIDEYDTPAHASFIGGYYDSFISFLRNWLSSALKDNPYLELGILTGILRIAKESIFSGLNNIETFTILDEAFQDKFGLLEYEVKELLEENNLSHKLEEMKQWYNGYRICSCKNIYNPWSVLSCISKNGSLAPYWVNTSENALMKELIAKGTGSFKADIEQLLKGNSIEKNIDDGIVFSELHQSPNAIWSLLLYSGYLTLQNTPSYGTPCQLRIPNIEVNELYKLMVLNWFEKSINEDNYRLLLKSLINGDIETFSQIFQEFMLSSVSVFDVPLEESEKIYHGFVLGMLIGLKDDYEVRSNRESGLGRYDVMLIPKNHNDLGIIMEFKKVGRFEKITLEDAVESALRQIEDKQYAQELIARGIKNILYIGFGFEGKQVLIRSKFKEWRI